MADKKPKMRFVTMEIKLGALKRIDNGESVIKVANDLNVGRSTVIGGLNKVKEVLLLKKN